MQRQHRLHIIVVLIPLLIHSYTADADVWGNAGGPRLERVRELGGLIGRARRQRKTSLRGTVGPRTSLVIRIIAQIQQLQAIDQETTIADNQSQKVSKQVPAPITKADVVKAIRILTGKEQVQQVKEPEAPPPSVSFKPEDDWRGARARLDLNPAAWIVTANGEQAALLADGSIIKAGDTVYLSHMGKRYEWKITSLAKDDIRLKQVAVK